MNYVKQFEINKVATRQVACIELHGKPNAATEGGVGVLGIDMDSPLHEVYKCVAVNGGIYTWELLSSGLSIMSATTTGGGAESVTFLYANLLTPASYVVKIGDLIIDNGGYLYQISALNVGYCYARYCGTQVVAYGKSAYALAVEQGFKGSLDDWLGSMKGDPGLTPYIGGNGNWWIGDTDTGEGAGKVESGSYVGTGASGEPIVIVSSVRPRMVTIQRGNPYIKSENGEYLGSWIESAMWVYPCSELMPYSYDYLASGSENVTPQEAFECSVVESEGWYFIIFTPRFGYTLPLLNMSNGIYYYTIVG